MEGKRMTTEGRGMMMTRRGECKTRSKDESMTGKKRQIDDKEEITKDE